MNFDKTSQDAFQYSSVKPLSNRYYYVSFLLKICDAVI
jgi:hypothetical protein